MPKINLFSTLMNPNKFLGNIEIKGWTYLKGDIKVIKPSNIDVKIFFLSQKKRMGNYKRMHFNIVIISSTEK